MVAALGQPDAPQRRRAPFLRRRLAVRPAGEAGPHVVQQQVGVGVDRLPAQAFDRVRVAGLHGVDVAGVAARLLE